MKLRLALPTLAFAALAALPAFAENVVCNTYFGDTQSSILYGERTSSTDPVVVSLTDLTTGWKVGNVYYLKSSTSYRYIPSAWLEDGKNSYELVECTTSCTQEENDQTIELAIPYNRSYSKYEEIGVRYIPWTYTIAFAKNATDAQGTAMTTMSGLSYTNTRRS